MSNQPTLFTNDPTEDVATNDAVVLPKRRESASMHTIADLIKQRANAPINKYVSREYQDYGYRLAMELGDEAHKALYIRMAKTYDRKVLEQARTFVLDANAQSKGKLFMWKVKQLKDAQKERQT